MKVYIVVMRTVKGNKIFLSVWDDPSKANEAVEYYKEQDIEDNAQGVQYSIIESDLNVN